MPLLAPAVIEGGLRTLEAKSERLSFDELFARHPDEVLALAAWNVRIEGPAEAPPAPAPDGE